MSERQKKLPANCTILPSECSKTISSPTFDGNGFINPVGVKNKTTENDPMQRSITNSKRIQLITYKGAIITFWTLTESLKFLTIYPAKFFVY